MKKLRRVLLIMLAVIFGVAVLILIGVNMYVQSQGTQARIQQELSQRLGTHVCDPPDQRHPMGGIEAEWDYHSAKPTRRFP